MKLLSLLCVKWYEMLPLNRDISTSHFPKCLVTFSLIYFESRKNDLEELYETWKTQELDDFKTGCVGRRLLERP
jgi:hypothetical protein